MEKTTSRWGWVRSYSSNSNNNKSCTAAVAARKRIPPVKADLEEYAPHPRWILALELRGELQHDEFYLNGILSTHASVKLGLDFPYRGSSSNDFGS